MSANALSFQISFSRLTILNLSSDISESEVLDPPSESDSGVESPKKVSSRSIDCIRTLPTFFLLIFRLSSSKKQLKRTNTVSKEKDEKKDKDKDEKKDEKKDDKKDKKDKKKDEGDMVKSPSSSRLTVDGEKTERSTSSKHLTKVPSKRDLKVNALVSIIYHFTDSLSLG